jgi:UDPglucose 6-dehydrogenase
MSARRRASSAVASVNEPQDRMAKKVEAFGGVAEKPSRCQPHLQANTDDMRDAPTSSSAAADAERAKIRAYDPEGMGEAKKYLDVELCQNAYQALDGADGVVILTEWNEFRALDLKAAKRLLKQPLMVDLRNIYRPDEMRKAGFSYISIGRPPVN